MDGLDGLAGPTGVTVAYHASFSVANTAALTDLISQLLPPLGPNASIVVLVNARYINNSGGSHALQVQISLGGTNIWGDNSSAIVNAANSRGFFLTAVIANDGVSNQQHTEGRVSLSTASAASVAGVGTFGGGEQFGVTFSGAPTVVDTSIAQTLKVSVQHAVAGLNISLDGDVTVLVIP